jgi:hypothetical protein
VSSSPSISLLVHETKEEHEYDREKALAVYAALQPFMDGDGQGYAEYESMSDEDRLVSCFELLNQSIFGDMIFAAINWDHGSTFQERGEDE